MAEVRQRPGAVRWMVGCDIRKVEQHADYILLVQNGRVLLRRGSGRLGIIAVLGPAVIGGQKFKRALLSEVGLGPSRPYRMASKGGMIRGRNRFAVMTAEQYRLVAPHIFAILQRWVDERVARWQCNPRTPFRTGIIKEVFSPRRGFRERVGTYECLNGRCFSVHREDTLLLADLYWRFIAQKKTRRQLRSMALFFDKALRVRKGSHRTVEKITEILRERVRIRERVRYIEGEREIVATTRLLPEWLLTELPGMMPDRRPSFAPCLKQIVYEATGWNGDLPPQIKLARAALPGVERRVPDLTLKPSSDLRSDRTLKGRRRDHDYRVFELMPSVDEVALLFGDAAQNAYHDDVPF